MEWRLDQPRQAAVSSPAKLKGRHPVGKSLHPRRPLWRSFAHPLSAGLHNACGHVQETSVSAIHGSVAGKQGSRRAATESSPPLDAHSPWHTAETDRNVQVVFFFRPVSVDTGPVASLTSHVSLPVSGCCKADRTAARNCSSSNGLMKKAKAPACSTVARAAVSSCPV